MSTSRRGFVQQMTATVAGASGAFAWGGGSAADLGAFVEQGATTWDVSWPTKLNGKHKAVFDCTEPESGYGVWRAGGWVRQYMDVLKTSAADMSPVVVLRHNAIALVMQQRFWDKYKVGAETKMTHPITGAPTDKNPVLLDEKDGVPAPFNELSLTKQIARGAVVLACNLALQDIVDQVKKSDGLSEDDARKLVVAAMIPGVILQPSGVFGVIRAQEAGCLYIKAS